MIDGVSVALWDIYCIVEVAAFVVVGVVVHVSSEDVGLALEGTIEGDASTMTVRVEVAVLPALSVAPYSIVSARPWWYQL